MVICLGVEYDAVNYFIDVAEQLLMQLLYFTACNVSQYRVSCIVAAYVGAKSKNLHFCMPVMTNFSVCKLHASLRDTVLFFFFKKKLQCDEG